MNVGQIAQKSQFIQPNWLSLSTFEAKTTTLDKVCRVANGISFGASVFGFYLLARGRGGLVAGLSVGLAARKIASTVIGYLVYPSALRTILCMGSPNLEATRKQSIRYLEQEDFVVREISINKSGTKYHAFLIAHKSTINNGKWSLNALGNCMITEESLYDYAHKNAANQCNTLMINGPSVKPVFYLTGTELDGVGAIRKLSQLGIRQIVIQHTSPEARGSDGVILDRTSLAYEAHKDPRCSAIFLESDRIDHNGQLPRDIEDDRTKHINNFLDTP